MQPAELISASVCLNDAHALCHEFTPLIYSTDLLCHFYIGILCNLLYNCISDVIAVHSIQSEILSSSSALILLVGWCDNFDQTPI